MIRQELVKPVQMNRLQRCGGCGAVTEHGRHVDSGRLDCGWGLDR